MKFKFATCKRSPEHLNSDTPSDSDEEVDVVTVDNLSTRCSVKENVLKADDEDTCLTPKMLSYFEKNGQLVARKPTKSRPSEIVSNVRFSVGQGEMRRTNKIFERNDMKSERRGCPNSRFSSDSDYPKRVRKEHNTMERKRRDDLRFSFQTLRKNIPELMHSSKASKVVILKRATMYVQQLQRTERVLEHSLSTETQRNKKLRRRLQLLLSIVRTSQKVETNMM
ncbi:myc protein-like [Tachypleus tridentatus]|uniref:myc protein-like n=1 Tax=Tachypleus tridentatus TaxID=6853 RepID=UPI003FD58A00